MKLSNSHWEILDNQLAETPWLCGDQFSLADISAGVWVWRREMLPINFKEKTNISKWFEKLIERPAYKKIVMNPLS